MSILATIDPSASALASYSRELAGDSGEARARFELARVFWELGLLDEARFELDAAGEVAADEGLLDELRLSRTELELDRGRACASAS